jgi:hypothetical protein
MAAVEDGSTLETDLDAGRQFLATLTAADLRACRFHRAAWDEVADESARIIGLSRVVEVEDFIGAAQRSSLPPQDRRWLTSLFVDPIVLANRSYTNGQHRGCALRFSGAKQAAVVIGYELLGEEPEPMRVAGRPAAHLGHRKPPRLGRCTTR